VKLEPVETGHRGAKGPSPTATPVRSSPRHAYCPLCGCARVKTAASDIRTTEDALCPGRCVVAWNALVALRLRESASERIATRRRSEYETGQPHPTALSEILMLRWRAGDWTVAPEDLLLQIQSAQAAS